MMLPSALRGKRATARASAIECELELMEGRLSKGEQVDLDVFTRSSSHLRRILETLGIERRQHDVTPTPLAVAIAAARQRSADDDWNAAEGGDAADGLAMTSGPEKRATDSPNGNAGGLAGEGD